MKIFEPSEEMARLRALIENAPEGSYIPYAEIAKRSSVTMNLRGKALLRSACRSAKRFYRVDRGKGIELDSPQNTMAIVTGRVKRVDNSLKRATKVSNALSDRYLAKLGTDDRTRLTAVVSLFGAISAMAKGLTRIYSEKPEALNTISNPSLPWKPK